MSNLVFDILRTIDNDDELFSIEDVADVRHWDYSLPTLTWFSSSGQRFTARHPCKSNKNFSHPFLDGFPLFRNMDMRNIVLAGGAVVSFLLSGSFNNATDLDFYVVGLGDQDDELLKVASTFLKSIIDWIDEQYRKEKVAHDSHEDKIGKAFTSQFVKDRLTVKREGKVMTITGIPTLSKPIQLILSDYMNVQELLRSSDIGCCAVAYSFLKEKLYFNRLSKFCIENLCFIAHSNSKHWPTVERLNKYFGKGFDIILPFLDIDKVPRRNLKYGQTEVLELKDFVVLFGDVEDNKISTQSIMKREDGGEEAKTAVTYTGNNSSADGTDSVYSNIRRLIRDEKEFVFVATGDSVFDCLLKYPKMSHRTIENSYFRVRKTIFDGGKIDLSWIEDYIVSKPVSQVLSEMLIESYKVEESNKKDPMDSVSWKSMGKQIRSYLKDLTTAEANLAKSKLDELKDKLESNMCHVPLSQSKLFVENQSTKLEDFYGKEYMIEKSL